MAKFRPQPLLGLFVGAFFGFVVGCGVGSAIGGDEGMVWLFIFSGAMAGLSLGTKFNPTVSVYWGWLVVVFGIGCIFANNIALEPRYQMHRDQRAVIPFEYFPYLFSALLATVIAMILAIARHANRLDRDEQDDAANFSLATILLVMGGASVAFGLLRWIDAPAAFYYIVVIFILGRFACLLVNAELTRRKKPPSDPAAAPENGQSEGTFLENTPD
jgi:hypothetical protein